MPGRKRIAPIVIITALVLAGIAAVGLYSYERSRSRPLVLSGTIEAHNVGVGSLLLCLGLVISSRSKTQMEAIQRAQMFLLPSIMLSGYIFPLSSIPAPLRVISRILPATHYITISRGIIIRGAGFDDFWPSVAALLLISAVLVAMSARAFQKTIR